MTTRLAEDARAVLLPAFDGLVLSDAVRRFLDRGGVSVLLGESRAEYVARGMSAERRAAETADSFDRLTAQARARSGLLIAAVDQEMGGICRLHDLVPAFPPRDELAGMTADSIQSIAAQIGAAAASFGVNMFLSPILDVLDGPNPWLQGRVFSDDPAIVADLSAAYIRGVQGAGVATTSKHFPGFRSVTGDPALDAAALSQTPLAAVDAGLLPFRAAIAAGTAAMMVGPAIVSALDAEKPALRSGTIIRKLVKDLGFDGVVMADDLDAQATMRGDDLATVAVDALGAGCDWLMLADIDDHLDQTADAIVAAVAQGRLSADRLAQSAAKVRDQARRYATSPQAGSPL